MEHKTLWMVQQECSEQKLLCIIADAFQGRIICDRYFDIVFYYYFLLEMFHDLTDAINYGLSPE